MKEIIPRILFFVLVIIISQVMLEPSSAETFSVDSGYIEVNGGSIFYEAAGNGPAVIMIHDGVTLMGCSSGGLLAIDFTLEHPERVSSLVLVCPIISGFGFSKHFNTRGDREKPKADAPVAEKITYWARKDLWITAHESKAAKDKIEMLLTAYPQNMSGSGRYARGPGRSALGSLRGSGCIQPGGARLSGNDQVIIAGFETARLTRQLTRQKTRAVAKMERRR